MEQNEAIEKLLTEHGIRPTSVRILVWKTISKMHDAFSLADLEAKLLSVDRSSIFRALTLFAEEELLSTVDDGSGQKKYCLATHTGSVNHIHFTCTQCGRTQCLKSTPIPAIELPDDYVIQHTSYVVHGLCPLCSEK